MVKLLLMLVFSIGQLHAASLSILPEKAQIEQGRSVIVNILYVGPTSPDELNVKRWQTQVFTEKGYRKERELPDGQVEVKQRLTLFPRQSGLLTLGPLALGGAKSQRFNLMVTPAVVNNVDITPIWDTLPEQIWQGESIESCVSMPLSEQRNRIKIESLEIPGISAVQTLSRTGLFEEQLIAKRCWRFSAQQSGNYLIELPPIIQRGRGRWTFYLPAQVIEVLPLPSYLPNSISIGKPNIEVQQGELGWRISVQVVAGSSAQTLWGVRSALARAMAISTDQIIDSEGEFFVPYKRWSFGQIVTVKLPFFNTLTGRLDTVDLLLKAPWKLPMTAIVLLSLVAVAILIKVTLLAGAFRQRRARVQAFKRAIYSATTADQLRSLVLASGCAGAEGSERYKTLQHWADAQGDQEATWLAHSINQLAFSKSDQAPLEEIKRALINRLTL